MSQFRAYRSNNFPPVIKNLIILNVLAWLAQSTLDSQFNITSRGALWPINIPLFEPYQLVTHMFLHAPGFGNIFHILFNMFALFIFGRILENRWGPKRFLIFYLACGLGAAFAHLAMQYFMGGYAPVVGASGAVMGVMIGFAYLFPNTELMIMPFPFPIKAKWFALIYVGLDLFGGFGRVAGDNVAHFAHLGGALTGFIIVLIWNKTNRRTFY
jgi:membrane associated rhomboid family serine protease